MTSSISAVIAWPLIGAMLLVVAARWRWFNGTSAERYLNATLTVIVTTQLLREHIVERFIADWSPLTETAVQQVSLCTIVASIAPFLCVISLLSGRDPKVVRRQQFLFYFVAGVLALGILAAGTRARRGEQSLEISGGWDGVLAWVAFSVLPLFLAFEMVRRCAAEYRQSGVTAGEKLVLVGIAVAGATIGVTTMIAAVLAVLQELRLVDSVEYRLATHSRNFFWIATTIGAVSAAPLVKEVAGYLGYDSTSKRWRRLQPMWQAMVSMFPDSRLPLDSSESGRRVSKVQLHRTTVEIRDAILRLRPYCRAVDPSQLAGFVASERVPGRERESAELALQLAAAAQDRSGMGTPPGDAAGMTAPSPSASLDDEVAELLPLAKWWVVACRFVATRHSPDFESVPNQHDEQGDGMTEASTMEVGADSGMLPHPPFRLPLLGDVLTTDFAKPCQRLAEQARELGPVFEQKLFGYPAVIVTGTRAVDEVNDESVWEKHVGHSLMKLRPLAGDGLFTAFSREPNWEKAHNVLMPAFTKAAMANYHATIIATVRELTDAWSAQATNTWIDVPEHSNALTFEIIARAGFSHSFRSMAEQRSDPFVEAMVRELTYANRRTDVLPVFERIFRRGRARQHQEDLTHAHSVVDSIIAARRTQSGTEHHDILDLMLSSTDPESGESLDPTNIRNQILTFLVAGSETSANTIAFALHYLSIHPEIADGVRAELDERWPTRDFPDIRFEDVAKLRGLRRVVDETLRLWPTGPGYFRRARQDTTLCDGRYRFRQKDWVLVLLLAAHRDPAWGPDADEFNPDRFLPDNIRNLPPHIFKPFGTGPRACIGRQFAQHEITVALAAILHQFDLEPDPHYRLDVRETLTLKPTGLRLRFHQRTSHRM